MVSLWIRNAAFAILFENNLENPFDIIKIRSVWKKGYSVVYDQLLNLNENQAVDKVQIRFYGTNAVEVTHKDVFK